MRGEWSLENEFHHLEVLAKLLHPNNGGFDQEAK